MLAKAEGVAKYWAEKLPTSAVNRLKDNGGVASVRKRPHWKNRIDAQTLWRQLRRITFNTDKSREQLEYEPLLNFEQSMQSFHQWYRVEAGIGGENWDLLKYLEPAQSLHA